MTRKDHLVQLVVSLVFQLSAAIDEAIDEVYDEAVSEERERCAKIADEYAQATIAEARVTAEGIAASIRSSK